MKDIVDTTRPPVHVIPLEVFMCDGETFSPNSDYWVTDEMFNGVIDDGETTFASLVELVVQQ
jgi:hypothetical protein